jgi:L-threonylcarbamoyladenylate synthase
MRIFQVDPDDPDPALVGQAAELLGEGGIVAYPTDTLYGLAVDPRCEQAVERLYRAKERAPAVAVPLIAASVEQAFLVGTFSDTEISLARAFWPGPLSIVVPASPLVSRRLVGAGETVAVRVPAHAVARGLALALGCPVTATSANKSGAPPAASAQEAAAVAGFVDAIVDAGPSPGGAPSTIVQLTADGPRLLRAGPIAWGRVLTFLQ